MWGDGTGRLNVGSPLPSQPIFQIVLEKYAEEWKTGHMGFEPTASCSGGKRSIHAELMALVIGCSLASP